MDKSLLEVVGNFGERLKRAKGSYLARTGEELTQTQLADLVGKMVGRTYDQTAAGNWFKGTIPNTYTIAALASIFRVSPGWLAFEEGAMLAGYHEPPRPMQPMTKVESPERRRKSR